MLLENHSSSLLVVLVIIYLVLVVLVGYCVTIYVFVLLFSLSTKTNEVAVLSQLSVSLCAWFGLQ